MSDITYDQTDAAPFYLANAIKEARADERRRTLQEAIEVMCPYCREGEASSRNLEHIPYKSESGHFMHDGKDKTGIWTVEFCWSSELHDLREKEATG